MTVVGIILSCVIVVKLFYIMVSLFVGVSPSHCVSLYSLASTVLEQGDDSYLYSKFLSSGYFPVFSPNYMDPTFSGATYITDPSHLCTTFAVILSVVACFAFVASLVSLVFVVRLYLSLDEVMTGANLAKMSTASRFRVAMSDDDLSEKSQSPSRQGSLRSHVSAY